MINILHITAHLGGGVGKILSSIAIHSKDENVYKHTIVTLEKTQTLQFEELCRNHDIEVVLATECDMHYLLAQADIVQVDWWHHPLTSQFITEYLGKIQCRLLLWSHVSGCSYPFISPGLVSLPDAFVFSTPFSHENNLWTETERQQIISTSDIVVSSGIEFEQAVQKREHIGFNVGYVGFLSYDKTHPEFIAFCESVCDIPTIRFSIVGDISYGKQLIADYEKSMLLAGKMAFTGYSLDVLDTLRDFDVFGYPLNPNHYGTAENVLLEAMGAGVVPVVLKQCTEKYLVQNMKTGLVVRNIVEYAEAIRWLYQNPKQRIELGENASTFIMKEYHVKVTAQKMSKIYERLLQTNKKLHDPIGVCGKTPYDWFLSCYVGSEDNIKGSAFAETKGSAKHYLKYFPDNRKLRKVVEKNESRNKTIL